MRNLYKIYYSTVIPGYVKAYQNLSNKKYNYDKSKVQSGILYIIKSLFKNKLYYPENKSSLLK